MLFNALLSILIGAFAGFVASNFIKGSSSGLLMNILLGIVGAVVGGYVLGWLGLTFGSFVGRAFTSVLGAALVLWLAPLIKK